MAEIKDLKRMCDFHSYCSKCELFDPSDSCGARFLPDNVDEIVDKWVKEHPLKTYMQDFYEKFPNAYKENDRPAVCRALIYGEESNCFYGEEPNCFKIDCKECWNQFMRGE